MGINYFCRLARVLSVSEYSKMNSGRVMERWCNRRFKKVLAVVVFLFALFQPFHFGLKGAWVESVDLNWTVPPEPDVSGYRIYLGKDSRDYYYSDDLGSMNDAIQNGIVSYTLGDLYSDEVYYVAVTAYDLASNESKYSNEKLLVFGRASGNPEVPMVRMHGSGGCGFVERGGAGSPPTGLQQIVLFLFLLFCPLFFLILYSSNRRYFN